MLDHVTSVEFMLQLDIAIFVNLNGRGWVHF